MRPRGNIVCAGGGRCQALSRRRLEKHGSGAAACREGWIHLTFAREKNGGRRDSSDRNAEEDLSTRKTKPKKRRADSPEVGLALRSVYQRTVEEDIPPDLLDLLGKLG